MINPFTSKSARENYLQSVGGMGNEGMTNAINEAFDVSDKAAMDYMGTLEGTAPGNRWDAYNEGVAAAKSGAWDDYWGGKDGSSVDFDFSEFSAPDWSAGPSEGWNPQSAQSNLDDFTNKYGRQEDDSINAPSQWEAMQAGNWETLTDAWKQLQQQLGNSQNTFNFNTNSANALAAGQQAALQPYQATMQAASDALRDAQLANSASRYQAVDDILRANTLAGQRATNQGTTGATDRLLLGARAQAAQDRAAIEEQANLAAAQRDYSLAGMLASAEKTIADNRQSKLQAVREALSADREAIHDAFARTVGSTREETAALMELVDIHTEQKAEAGKIGIENAREARDATLASLMEAMKSGGTFLEQEIEKLLDELDAVIETDKAAHQEAQTKMSNLEALKSMLNEILTSDVGAAATEGELAELAEFWTKLIGLTGGNPTWYNAPALAETSKTSLESLLAPTPASAGVGAGLPKPNQVLENTKKYLRDAWDVFGNRTDQSAEGASPGQSMN